MSAVPIPDPASGPDGEQPPAGGGARDAVPAGSAADETAQASTAPDGSTEPDGSTPPAAADDDAADDDAADDGWDAAADLAAMLEEIDAGLIAIPPEDEYIPAVTVSVGEAADVDPAELASMTGPQGLGGQCFTQYRSADAMRPGPLLSVLAEQAAADPGSLSGDELLGVVSAARRLQARAEYLELAAVAEFAARSRAAYAASVAGKAPRGRRDGEFAASELAMELVVSTRSAEDRMEFAAALAARLPATFAGLAAGLIDGGKASVIWFYTRFLSDADAAYADAVLAAAAPGMRYDSLSRKAARLEMKLDPAAVRARKEAARAEGRRVEARREASGNMSFGGRELSVEEALAAKAFNDGDALGLRRAGLAGSLRELRLLALLDRMAGRDPFARIPAADPPAGPGDPGSQYSRGTGPCGDDDPAAHAGDETDDDSTWCPAPGDDDDDDEDDGRPDDGPACPGGGDPGGSGPGGSGPGGPGGGGPGGGGPGAPPPGGPAPVPALINLVIPAGTLLGWSTAPGDAGSWGLLDPDDTRAIAAAASRHPATRWCLTVTAPDGTAAAHGCARGQHPWTPATGPPAPTTQPSHTPPRQDPGSHSPPSGTPPPHAPPRRGPPGKGPQEHGPQEHGPQEHGPQEHGPPGPDNQQRAALAALIRDLNITLSPINRRTCDHARREDRYTPSRALAHLIRARTTTCPAPGCGAQAAHNDIDHTTAWPAGPSDECNLSPPCRRHHRVKQAPGWRLEQPEPGVMRWTTPSGRTHTTTPTVYDT